MLKGFIKIFSLIVFFTISAYSQGKYAVSIKYTPVLNTSDYNSVFGYNDGNSVKLDNRGLIGEIEFIALPNTVFEILESISANDHFMYKVITDDYPYKNSLLFVDSRFVKLLNSKPPYRTIENLSDENIISNLNSLNGLMYMWGGNTPNGISELLDYYPPKSEISENIKSLWKLKGVDCSGLLYYATVGATPRNTSSLITFGDSVNINGLNAEQISNIVQPLDLIAWDGHVVIVLDNQTTIESTPDRGVHKTNLLSRLKYILKDRNPVNDWNTTSGKRFVIRKWYK
jgi:hypothetical protein